MNTCINCQKNFRKEIKKTQNVKTCPWCTKVQAPRQSLRPQRSKKK